ncbi:HeH/LEM domain-containing protein [Variovorax sp. YR634]|uniref:HeH/LEM domain-containing protein n=1 Tax=Variovorax sp. YR634 TaxID=1884385 RepID=UPI00089AF4F9|nr:HeH/LEM domain-containing protein [Variovorax sp. YR634]SDX13154.1 HeH/LEM domain-containing protein [Variovorax sp. YR634]
MNVIKIKPSHESQGPFVLINEGDFDPKKHELYEEPIPEGAKKASDGLKVEDLKAELEKRKVEIPEGAKKADLAALLDAAVAAEAAAS